MIFIIIIVIIINNNSWLALSRNKKKIKPFGRKSQDIVLNFVLLWEINKEVTSPSLCGFLNFRYSSKYFAQIHRGQYGAAIAAPK